MYEMLKFNLARDALSHFIKLNKIKEMHIPYYLCDVVRHTLVQGGCKPLFYHIDDNFYPLCEFDYNDYILYPNYWGICGVNVKKLTEKYPKLIVDNAHAFYDNPSGIACFNAGHKFGHKESYLWIKSELSGQTYINLLDDNAKLCKEKFLELHNEYKNINKLQINLNSIPYVYPCMTDTIEEADELVKELKKKGKTVYRFWSPLPKSYGEYKFYSRLVPIPILPLS